MISENVRTEAVSGRVNWHNWWDSGFDFKTGTSTVGQAFGAVPNTCNPPPLAVSFGCGNLVYSGTDTAGSSTAVYPTLMTTRTQSGGQSQQGNISSNHGNGSNVVFCDSHAQFLSSNMDNTAYNPGPPQQDNPRERDEVDL